MAHINYDVLKPLKDIRQYCPIETSKKYLALVIDPSFIISPSEYMYCMVTI